MPAGTGSTSTSPPKRPSAWVRARQITETIALVFLGVILLFTLWYAAKLHPFGVQASTTAGQAASTASNLTGTTAPGNQTSQPGGTTSPQKSVEAQVEDAVSRATAPLNDEIKTREDQQRSVLDRLVTLVGGYSLLIGLTAYFSLKSARDEAQSQNALSATQLGNHMKLAEEMLGNHLKSADDRVTNLLKSIDDRLTNYLRYTSDELQLVRKGANDQLGQNKTDWAEFKTLIWSELPDMRTMQRGLRSLLFELEKIIAPETDWNDERAYEALNEEQKQEILISELTIAALPTLISRDATESIASLARLYRALARFYFGRYKVEKSRTDADRADAYISRALNIDAEHAGSYRLRGAVYLAEQRLNPSPSGQPDPLLNRAEKNLRLALQKDKNDLGSYYNLALALERGGHRPEGIELIRGVLLRWSDFSEAQKRKYVASIVLNQACDLNAEARAAKDPAQHKILQDEALKTVVDGWSLLLAGRDTNGLVSLRKSIDRELKPAGDLGDLTPDHKATLSQHMNPKVGP